MIKYPYHWKIWYDNRSVFDSNDGNWDEAPPRGVQAIAFLRPDTDEPKLGGRGWEIAQGGAFFRMTDDGHVVPCDMDALVDYVADVLGIIKVGRMLSAAQFREIMAEANKDLDELQKQGFSKKERRP